MLNSYNLVEGITRLPQREEKRKWQNIEEKNLKSIKSVTYRAFELLTANSNLLKFNHCDLIIEPKELTNYSTFETNRAKMDLIFEIGYNEAKKAFENLDL